MTAYLDVSHAVPPRSPEVLAEVLYTPPGAPSTANARFLISQEFQSESHRYEDDTSADTLHRD